MFALVDCNNFYASCERLFRPDLRQVPIVVLSNNDGCCIARSNEAQALGITMGEPYFKIKTLCTRHGVKVFSSNYTLYGNISHRVMSTIEESWPEVEIYSIDEAFLDLSKLPSQLHVSFCKDLQQKILKNIGIPTTIGIGATKTLAKAANYLAKKVLQVPVFDITPEQKFCLERIPIHAVWGIGRQWSKKLLHQGIHTAYDLAKGNAHILKKHFSVVMMRTALELQGISCLKFEEPKPKQNIMSSKSFGQMQTSFANVAQSLSSHCARAVEKMRSEKLVAQSVYVFVHTNRYREDLGQHFQSIEVNFITPTDNLMLITKMAKRCLLRVFKPGYFYKKAGVCLQGLISKENRQRDMFCTINDEQLAQTEKLMSVVDEINSKYGRSTIRLAAEGYAKPGKMLSEHKSPAYTTRWSDILQVHVG